MSDSDRTRRADPHAALSSALPLRERRMHRWILATCYLLRFPGSRTGWSPEERDEGGFAMTDWLLEELVNARKTRMPCALITVAATKGSVPRAPGSKMIVYHDGTISSTIGGGKFESLVIRDALQQMREKTAAAQDLSAA